MCVIIEIDWNSHPTLLHATSYHTRQAANFTRKTIYKKELFYFDRGRLADRNEVILAQPQFLEHENRIQGELRAHDLLETRFLGPEEGVGCELELERSHSSRAIQHPLFLDPDRSLLQLLILRLDRERKLCILQSVLVGREDDCGARQGSHEGFQALVHLESGSFEQATTAHREQRVSAEERIRCRDPERAVVEGVTRDREDMDPNLGRPHGPAGLQGVRD